MGYLISFAAGYIVCHIGVEKIMEKTKEVSGKLITVINSKIKKTPTETVSEEKEEN